MLLSEKHERRFLQRVLFDDGCWEWDGAHDSNGYAQMNLGGDTYDRGHRVAYRLFVGRIPEGMVVHHRCANTGCVRFDHLEALTPAAHLRLHFNPAKPRRTHCFRGHELTDENVIVRKDASKPSGFNRICRTCRLESRRRRREARS